MKSRIDFFIESLKSYRDILTKQQIKTLRGQAIHGDLDGAKKGLKKLVERAGNDENND